MLFMTIIPLVFINCDENTILVSENRKVSPLPHLWLEDGNFNYEFSKKFEKYMDDNIGFRDNMVITNAKIQYYIFNVLANNSDRYLGPNGEISFAPPYILADYQRINLYSEDYLKKNAESMQIISNYAEKCGAKFYYFQCWDKHSIYPEYFPNSVIQNGDVSKTDELIRGLNEYSDVNVISSKNVLIEGKSNYQTFSKYGDPTHWTPRGAYISYKLLMDTVNSDNDNKYKVLDESDYDILITDQGKDLFGGIHKEDMLEQFEIKDVNAFKENKLLTLYSEDDRHSFYVNENVDNNDRVLIIGDSYFNGFIVDDIAESFHETIMIWHDYTCYMDQLIDEYKPDIIILEAAERCDISYAIIDAAEVIEGK